MSRDLNVLRLNVDRKLSWRKHKEEVEASYNKSRNIIGMLSGKKWEHIQTK
jgi:hypothetical protein